MNKKDERKERADYVRNALVSHVQGEFSHDMDLIIRRLDADTFETMCKREWSVEFVMQKIVGLAIKYSLNMNGDIEFQFSKSYIAEKIIYAVNQRLELEEKYGKDTELGWYRV